jgi:hypothetical protein
VQDGKRRVESGVASGVTGFSLPISTLVRKTYRGWRRFTLDSPEKSGIAGVPRRRCNCHGTIDCLHSALLP